MELKIGSKTLDFNFARRNSAGAEKVVNGEAVMEKQTDELPHGGVVMYCTSWCPSCRRARTWLGEHHIPYIEVDISKNRNAASQVRQWANGNETTPTFDIDGTIIVDYDERKLAEVLKVK